MIANARMYSVSPEAAALWRALLAALIEQPASTCRCIEHAEPAPIAELVAAHRQGRRVHVRTAVLARRAASRFSWRRRFPRPPNSSGLPQYWSEMVVRRTAPFDAVADTFGGRIALTVPILNPGAGAALHYLMSRRAIDFPLYEEIIAPQVTPLGAMQR